MHIVADYVTGKHAAAGRTKADVDAAQASDHFKVLDFGLNVSQILFTCPVAYLYCPSPFARIMYKLPRSFCIQF
jgi:hypothetical protein